jgi:phage gp16-like protein
VSGHPSISPRLAALKCIAPDIQKVKAEASELARRAQALRSSPAHAHADGAMYYREEAEADDLSKRARQRFLDASMMERARDRDLKKIHCDIRQIAMSDDAYRALVSRHTAGRTNSSGNCSAAERRAILAELKEKGAKPQPKRGGARRITQAEYVQMAWQDLYDEGAVRDATLNALGDWLAKRTTPPKRRAEHLGSDEAQRIIEQLKAWLAREKEKGCRR